MDLSRLQEMQSIFDVIPNPVFVKNRRHQIVLLNESACALFGHSREVLLSCSDTDLFLAEELKVFHDADDRVFEGRCDDESEERITDPSGVIRSVITRKRLTRLGGEEFLTAVVTDVTARREAEAKFRHLAFHDPLTSLPNRALLNERIDEALLRGRRDPRRCALIYIDLDRFKDVNDEHGHHAGDLLIREFAKRLRRMIRPRDMVARLGGDEFAILLPATHGDFSPDQLCRGILGAAAKAFDVGGSQVFVGASIGVVRAPKAIIGQVELQRCADVALYQAKREGRGCWRVFTEELDARDRHRREIEADMREAMATFEGFEVHYQPIVATRGERVLAMEALLRWRHPELGLLLPNRFISIAEDTGLIVPLGEWVLERACTMIGQWPDVSIAINVSPVQLRRSDLASRILEITERVRLAPDRLQIEVTESAIIDVDSVASVTLKTLRSAGVKIVLDDFGTGYSSLAHLQKWSVDRVKIDRSFVRPLGTNDDAGFIVHAVADLCQKLGVSVTAEGVETLRQRDFLRSSACAALQGFLFSRPLTEHAATRYLDAAFGPVLAAA
jgi:diguanylate cyclase (GGDEF)-like protein/PAS domain S-box-containing protein